MNMIEFLSSNQGISHETSDTVISRQLLSRERERLLCMKILLRLADYLSFILLLLFSPRYYHELIVLIIPLLMQLLPYQLIPIGACALPLLPSLNGLGAYVKEGRDE